MTKRAFLLGCAAGAAAVLLVQFLLGERYHQDRYAESTTSQQPSVEASQDASASRPFVETPPVQTKLPPVEMTDSASGSSEPGNAPPSAPQRSSRAVPATPHSPEGNTGVEDSTAQEESTSAEDAAPDDQPKDPAWSYQMEQAIQQLLASHPEAAQFAFSSVRCRDTFCQVRAFTHDERAFPAWQRIAYDIKQEPWSDFGVTGTSFNPSNGRLAVLMTLYRRPPKS